VEYLVVVYDENNKEVVVSLRQADILKALANDTELTSQGGGVPDLQHTTGAEYGNHIPPTANASPHADSRNRHKTPLPVFHPEFGRFMLEATPGAPWGIGFKELLDVEPDMKLR
jgi:glutamate--cysteine ligase catalytic subunit